MKRNIFVTAIGGDIACATLRCIVNNNDYGKLVGCDIHEYIQGRVYVDQFIIAPSYFDEECYMRFLEKVCKEQAITHFFPMTEIEIDIANKNRAFFKKNNIHLMINSAEILSIATSKYRTARYLADNAIKTPETYYLNEYKGQLQYPLIIKEDHSSGSKNVRLIDNKSDFEESIKQFKIPIIQKYIGDMNEEYTMGIFSDGVSVKSIAFKRKLGYSGMSIHVETVKEKRLDELAQQISQIFKLKGLINVQLRKDGQEFSIFEINPRISSTVGFRHLLGFKDVIWWLNLVEGKNCCEHEYIVESGIIGIKTFEDLIFMKNKLLY